MKGKIIFQHKYINSSYRIRGNTPRIKIIKNTIKLTYILALKPLKLIILN